MAADDLIMQEATASEAMVLACTLHRVLNFISRDDQTVFHS